MEKTITVYLAHLSEPMAHARHYVGSTVDLEKRNAMHAAGTGARMLKHAAERGITWTIERTWQADERGFETLLKRQKNAAKLCPICSGPAAYNRGIDPQKKTKMRSQSISARQFAVKVGISYPVMLRLLKSGKIRGAVYDKGLKTWLVPSAQIPHVIKAKSSLVKRGRPWPTGKEVKNVIRKKSNKTE